MTATAVLASAPPAGHVSRGRTRITAKALNRVVSAVTADALGVGTARVRVDLDDQDGLLVLTVTTPIRVVSLERVRTQKDALRRAGGSVLDRAARAQEIIRDRVNGLTGSSIGRVTVRISGVDIQPEERVR